MPQTFKYKTETFCVGLSLVFAILTLPSSLYSWHHLPPWIPRIFAESIDKMSKNQRPVQNSGAPASSFQGSASNILKRFNFKSKTSGDSFSDQPKSQTASLLANLKLSGVIAGTGDGSQAVINDEIYGEGQTVAGFVILRIDSSKVLLSKNGENYALTNERLTKIPEKATDTASNEGDPI